MDNVNTGNLLFLLPGLLLLPGTVVFWGTVDVVCCQIFRETSSKHPTISTIEISSTAIMDFCANRSFEYEENGWLCWVSTDARTHLWPAFQMLKKLVDSLVSSLGDNWSCKLKSWRHSNFFRRDNKRISIRNLDSLWLSMAERILAIPAELFEFAAYFVDK